MSAILKYEPLLQPEAAGGVFLFDRDGKPRPFAAAFGNPPLLPQFRLPNSFYMKSIVPTLLRAVLTFGVFCGLQYLIPYYLLALGGVAAGFFMLKTSDDRPLAIGVLIGSLVFLVFAYLMAQLYPQ